MQIEQNAAYETEQTATKIDQIDSSELTELLDHADFGLAIFDPDLRLQHTNAQYALLCRYSPEQIAPGTELVQMIRTSLQRQGSS